MRTTRTPRRRDRRRADRARAHRRAGAGPRARARRLPGQGLDRVEHADRQRALRRRGGDGDDDRGGVPAARPSARAPTVWTRATGHGCARRRRDGCPAAATGPLARARRRRPPHERQLSASACAEPPEGRPGGRDDSPAEPFRQVPSRTRARAVAELSRQLRRRLNPPLRKERCATSVLPTSISYACPETAMSRSRRVVIGGGPAGLTAGSSSQRRAAPSSCSRPTSWSAA